MKIKMRAIYIAIMLAMGLQASAEQPSAQNASPFLRTVSDGSLINLQPIGIDTDSVDEVQQTSFTLPGFSSPASAACCTPPWAHRCGVFAEAMWLRARDAEIVYALPVNGNVPEGAVGLLDPDYELGYRGGFTKAFDNCSSFGLTYSSFNSDTSSFSNVAAPLSLTKALVHPNEANAAANVLQSGGNYDLDFHTLDLEYRFIFLASECTAVNFSVGARLGKLDQEMTVVYSGTGLVETITTDVEFQGAGIRLGADVERHTSRGLFAYGKTNANFLGGEFEASYLHASSADPVRVLSTWEAGRIVSILELEAGIGWQPASGLRLSAGYMLNAWLNAVKTDDWVNGVRNNVENFRDMSDALTFDGFVARAEYRF